MTIIELHMHLTELLEDPSFDGDQPVRVAQQPTYPLHGALRGVAVDDDGQVFVVSGEATEYASRDLWEQLM